MFIYNIEYNNHDNILIVLIIDLKFESVVHLSNLFGLR